MGGTPEIDDASLPHVTGPIVGGLRGWAFAAAASDLEAMGYVEEEWFLDGNAVSYRDESGAERSWDGRWTAVPDLTARYKTRVLIRRPANPERFNGTAVLIWNNVTLGFDLLAGESPEIYDGGFMLVAVSAQRVGVHGFPGDASPGLRVWDPERYGSLSIPADLLSYDIYTQAAALVRTGALGLQAERVVGLGASLSAVYLATYRNTIQPLSHALDGLILEIYFGNGAPLRPPAQAAPATDPVTLAAVVASLPPGGHLLRDDLDLPVLVLNSETESTSYHPVRQPDTDRYRLWEIAGASHAPAVRGTARVPSPWPRDLGVSESPMGTPTDANTVVWEPVRSAALQHMQRWLTDGTPPPAQPRIEFEPGPRVRRDAYGIALGGIRLPEVEVPIARHSGRAVDGTLRLAGSTTRFEPGTLEQLYPDAASYRERWFAAVNAAVAAGVIRAADATDYEPELADRDTLRES